MFAAPVFRADACLSSLPAIFNAEHCHPWLAFPARPIRVHLSRSAPPPPSSSGLQRLRRRISVVFPVQAQQIEVRGDEPALSDWEGDGEGVLAQEVAGWDETEGEASEWDTIDEGKEDVAAAAFREPPEDAKLFVGNLPFDVDSEMLARLFQKAGVVELAEVIYNRETDQSRGFGFVVMSSVEEAEKAVEKLDRQYFEGRMLTVKKAAPRGSRAERSRSERIYVGNLPWSVDEARLEQVFGEYGQVLDSKVVCDRESGRSRGFAFVTMSAPQETENAIAALDGKNLDGRTIRVNAAEEKPRRGGAF